MPRTFKDFLEVYRPKSPDEQKFVDKHVVIKHKDRNGNGDDVFKATNIKTIERKKERHGFNVGEDEKVYENVADQETLDENVAHYKNYIISSHYPMLGTKERGDIRHVVGHPQKTEKLRIKSDDYADYGETRHIIVTNNDTGESTHHHVYQSGRPDRYGDRTFSIRSVDSRHTRVMGDHAQDKHQNVLAHYLSGKTKIKEEIESEALLDEALDLLNSIDEKTLTPAEMKKREEVVKAIKRGNPKMDKAMAYAIATKTAKRVTEEAFDLDDGKASARERFEHHRKEALKIANTLAIQLHRSGKGEVHWGHVGGMEYIHHALRDLRDSGKVG